MKKFIYAVLALSLVFILSTAGNTTAQEDDPLVFVIVSHGGEGNPYWRVVIKGMEDACALLEAECHWLSDPVDSVEEMGNYWNAALALEPDGIGTTVPDPEVIREQVEEAAEMGIPVISLDTADPNAGTDEALPILFYIGGDEFVAGQGNAERLFEEAEANGDPLVRGACTIHEEGHSGLQARCDGAQTVFDEAGVPFDVIHITNDVSESAGLLSAYFEEHPDTNAIFLGGLNPALAYALYVEEAGREPGEIYAASYDNDPQIIQLIQDGYLVQTVDAQPYSQGFETIMWLFLNSQYDLRPGGDILTGPGFVDADNVDQIIELTTLGYR